MIGRTFRVWDKRYKQYVKPYAVCLDGRAIVITEPCNDLETLDSERAIIEFGTGLKDKNSKEIYENCELDGRYRVEYIAPKFVGKDMIKGDIIELYDNKFTITKEHCEISQNSERGIN